MSKGSPSIKVRLPKDLLARVEEAARNAVVGHRECPLTVSEWIRRLVENKLRDLESPRRKRKPLSFRCAGCGVEVSLSAEQMASKDDRGMKVMCGLCVVDGLHREF